MRILYIYNEYGERRKLYGKIMEKLGHKVSYFCIRNKLKKNQVNIKHIKNAKPDPHVNRVIRIISPIPAPRSHFDADRNGSSASDNELVSVQSLLL